MSARQPGNIMVYTALALTVFMGVAGSSVDYGMAVIEASQVQNAADAAALAGARAMVVNSGGQAAADAGQAAASNYLGLHGYVPGANGVTVSMVVTASTCPGWAGRTWNGSAWSTGVWTCSAPSGTVWPDVMRVDVTRSMATRFWQVIGIDQTTVMRTATAAAGADFVDVMLSLDLSGSMELSGTNDLQQLRAAVISFIDQMRVDPTEARGSRVGIARWAGIKCGWYRGVRTPTPAATAAPGQPDGDTYIDLDRNEYRTPCSDDMTVLSTLSQNRDQLVKIADGTGPAACPASATGYGCPLISADYNPPTIYGTPIPTTTPVDYQYGGTAYSWTHATGTKLPNAISVVSNGAYHAWSTANNGRNNAVGEGTARKVLVLMTDGFNEASELGIPSGAGTTGQWDTDVVNQANTLKLGPDGVAGTPDDVEIFVVGFFCSPYAPGSTGVPSRWCQSAIGGTTPHLCPGPTWPTTGPAPSGIDTRLRDVSSSSPGTCDHYFPVKKTESLPQLFRVLAGSVARSRLS